MQEDELTSRYPRCYHLAHGPDAWPSIERHGLLSVAALLEKWDVPPEERRRLLRKHRSTTIRLTHPVYGTAYLRDQHPMNVKMLERALTDMTVPDWLEQLNRHVFLAPTPDRLATLHAAYAAQPRIVLTLDTRSPLAEHRYQTRLSAINTGAVRHVNHTRGSDTLQRVSLFDPKRPVAEIAVVNAVPDIARHTTGVQIWNPDGSRTTFA